MLRNINEGSTVHSHLRGPKRKQSLTPPFFTLHIHFIRKSPGLYQIPRPSQQLYCQVRPLDIRSSLLTALLASALDPLPSVFNAAQDRLCHSSGSKLASASHVTLKKA